MPLPFIPPDSYSALETPLTSTKLNQLVNAILSLKSYVDLLYPVGGIYISTASTNPATLFGFGTWVAIQGRFLIGAGTSDATYVAGATGGESNHTLTAAEIPVHAHTYHEMNNPTEQAAGGNTFWTTHYNDPLNTSNTSSIGGGAAHNNMPPYLVVYIWTRTA